MALRERRLARRVVGIARREATCTEALEAGAVLLPLAPDARARHRLLEAECWIGLGKPSEAEWRLHEVIGTIDRYCLDFLRSPWESLARRCPHC